MLNFKKLTILIGILFTVGTIIPDIATAAQPLKQPSVLKKQVLLAQATRYTGRASPNRASRTIVRSNPNRSRYFGPHGVEYRGTERPNRGDGNPNRGNRVMTPANVSRQQLGTIPQSVQKAVQPQLPRPGLNIG